MLRVTDLDFDLPEGRIATTAAEPRDSARMMVVAREGGPPAHRHVRDLPEYLRAGDLLVLNTTRVLPARLVGRRADTGAKAEGLFLRDIPGRTGAWVAMIRTRRLREGARIDLFDRDDRPTPIGLRLETRVADEPGAWVVAVEGAEGMETGRVLERVGRTPLPPYILAARRHAGLRVTDEADRARYQTVYAGSQAGSVAAPTAGMHLTEGLLGSLRTAGVATAEVVLHVGPGTFKPVEAEHVEEHPMHGEWCRMPEATRRAILDCRARGGRVVCVGTTACRAVESFARREQGVTTDAWMETRLLVTPGYRWGWTDGLLTNFHLPRSTLMALVAALLEGGVDRLKGLYAEAVAREYRFFSYGDAMLILPAGGVKIGP